MWSYAAEGEIMKELYNALYERINGLDFSRLWPGFKSFRFALYDDEKVLLGEEVFAKDERFIGNTAIMYGDEFLAIWDVSLSPVSDPDIFAVKIIHEMFHAFQRQSGETRWANELSGLKYAYAPDNLTIKHRENILLLAAYDGFAPEKLDEFFSLRKLRREKYASEVEYETRIETIEGLANYVELMALCQLSPDKYEKAVAEIKDEIGKVSNLIPIRKVCYYTGALLLIICSENGIPFAHKIGAEEKTFYELVAKDVAAGGISLEMNAEIESLIKKYHDENEKLIHDFIASHPCRLEGKYPLRGLDPMNTIKFGEYLYCKHFISYSDAGALQFVKQPCVVKVDEQFNILALYC